MAKLAIAKLTLYGKINNDSTNYGLMNHNSWINYLWWNKLWWTT
jgi:hypothetical protein